MQVQYRETKGGFECLHLPSIDMSSVDPSPSRHQQQSSSGSGEPSTPRPSIVKKASKLSFGVKKREREPSMDKAEAPSRPSGTTTLTTTPSRSSSFFNVSTNNTAVPSENEVTVSPSVEIDISPPAESASVKSKVLPPIPRDLHRQPGAQVRCRQLRRDVFETMGNNSLCVRFEINIVKVSLSFLVDVGRCSMCMLQVPWLPLHGIQFRRASGDGWQYQMLARRVLTELKL